jgi:hypothetical protein
MIFQPAIRHRSGPGGWIHAIRVAGVAIYQRFADFGKRSLEVSVN